MSREKELYPGERLDDLHRKGYKIIQHKERFCFGIDAVLLSAFTQVREGETVLDLGTGTGIIPILLEAKTAGRHFTGLEIQKETADMARRSVKYNHLEELITIVEGDLKEAGTLFKPASFDVVTSNPPYMVGSHGLINQDISKAIARHEISCTLKDVISQACAMLRVGGRFYMVHRPFRLTDIICILREYKLEPKRLQFVHPFADKEPNMVLVEAIRGRKSRIAVEKPLIIYQEPGRYTDEVYRMYGYPE